MMTLSLRRPQCALYLQVQKSGQHLSSQLLPPLLAGCRLFIGTILLPLPKDCMAQSSLSARRDATPTRKYCIGEQMVKTVEKRRTVLLISRLCKLSKTKLRGKGQSCLIGSVSKQSQFHLIFKSDFTDYVLADWP